MVLIPQKLKNRLSTAAHETLSIIAYRQPISKAEIEHVRGVNCDYSIQKLLEKELIEIEGKSDGPGKPLVYGTSKNFMDYFGLKNPTDLPKLKDIMLPENMIGEPSENADVFEASVVEQEVKEVVDNDATIETENLTNETEKPDEEQA